MPELKLKKNDPSPYDGVLIPEINYRTYKSDEQFNEYLKPKLEKLDFNTQCPQPMVQNDGFLNAITWMLIGMGLFATVASLHR